MFYILDQGKGDREGHTGGASTPFLPSHSEWEPHNASDGMIELLHNDCIPEVRVFRNGKYQLAVGPRMA